MKCEERFWKRRNFSDTVKGGGGLPLKKQIRNPGKTTVKSNKQKKNVKLRL